MGKDEARKLRAPRRPEEEIAIIRRRLCLFVITGQMVWLVCLPPVMGRPPFGEGAFSSLEAGKQRQTAPPPKRVFSLHKTSNFQNIPEKPAIPGV